MRRQWSEVSTTPLQKTEGGYAVFCLQWKRRKNNDVINDDVEANELVEKVPAHDEEDGVKDKLIPGDDLNDDDDIKKDDDQSSGDDNIRYIDDSFEKDDFQDEKKDAFQDEKKDHVNSDWTNPELSAPDKSEKGDSTVTNCVDRTLSEGTDVSRREKDGYSDFVNGVVDLR
ncbi:hypothetical protein FSP39_018811 [Pinctada imbricata]|uniref:Uncharacterized protein n=1 Tax=Pinctada imbricata TaxID=66713 RepID=A0AA88XWD9_PINIB|nr:hypothetical protein FSP39_018811 [Pinctada imbricata]